MGIYKSVGLPWSSGIGTKVDTCTTAREVMDQAKLNFNVSKCQLVADMPIDLFSNNTKAEIELDNDFIRNGRMYKHIADNYATYRTDLNIPLGIVKSKYEVVQNVDAFEFFDEAIGHDKCKWQYAGSFGYGEKIYVAAKIELTNEINVNGFKDPIDNYLVFTNTHDGSGSITIMFTPVRFFCINCLNAGLDKADSYIRIRHTNSAKDKLHRGAEVLRLACEKAKDAAQLYQALTTINMNDTQVLQYICELNLTNAERIALLDYDKNTGYKKLLYKDVNVLEATGISTRKANIIYNMFDYYNTGVAQNNILGTAWGAYNAVTGYFSNVANLEGEKRMESLLYGNGQNVTQKALNSIIELKAA